MEEYLYEFADGELEMDKEEDFCRSLADSDEMRSKLRSVLSMKTALNSHASYFEPPATAAGSIFTTLGLSAPALTNPTASGGLAGFLSAYRQFITGFIASALLMTGAYFLALPKSTPPDRSALSSAQVQISTALKQEPASQTASAQADQSAAKGIAHVKASQAPREVIRYVYVNKPAQLAAPDTIYIRQEVPPSQPEERTDLASANFRPVPALLVPQFSYQPMRAQSFNPPPFVEPPAMPLSGEMLSVPRSMLGLAVEYKGQTVRHYPDPTIDPHEFARFNNSALSLYYAILPQFYAGVELKQETFYQKYRGVNPDNNMSTYEQQPNFTTYALSLRYYPFNWNGLAPMLQTNLGGNYAGYVGRVSAGLSYGLSYNIDLILGAEYSKFFYTYQSNNYSSAKIGFAYSLLYHF